MGRERFYQNCTETYSSLHRLGSTALQAGEVAPFGGYASNVSQKFFVCLRLDESSSKDIAELVVRPLADEAGQLGLSAILAGSDFPMHVTLAQATPELMTDESAASTLGLISERMPAVSDFENIRDNLIPLTVKMDMLVIGRDGAKSPYETNVMLVANPVPKEVVLARPGIEKSLLDAAGDDMHVSKPMFMFHMTLLRITGYPKGELAQDNLYRWVEHVNVTTAMLQASGKVRAVFNDIYSGPMLPFLTGTAGREKGE